MTSTSTPSFTTATDVLQAILDGESARAQLRAYLTTQDVTDSRFTLEAWKGVCAETNEDPEEHAFNARMAVVSEFEDKPLDIILPEWTTHKLVELLVGSSQRTSYAAFGDEYIAGTLKLRLPAKTTVCVPRANPAYTQAANEFKETVNDIVRPLLKTSLKKKLIETRWDTPDMSALLAAIVTLREIIRAPEVYIDSDAAAADPDLPCIFIRRKMLGFYPEGFGVLHNRIFTPVNTPLEAISHWLLVSADCISGVDGLLDALNGEDTRSSVAKSIISGRKLLRETDSVEVEVA